MLWWIKQAALVLALTVHLFPSARGRRIHYGQTDFFQKALDAPQDKDMHLHSDRLAAAPLRQTANQSTLRRFVAEPAHAHKAELSKPAAHRSTHQNMLWQEAARVRTVSFVNPFREAVHGLTDAVDGVSSGANGMRYSPEAYAGVKHNSAHDLLDIFTGLQFTLIAGLSCLALFIVLLRFFPAVYAHRALEEFRMEDGQKLPMPTAWSVLSWFRAASAVTDEATMKAVGLDALMYVKFFQLCQRILLHISPVVILLIGPLHFIFGARFRYDQLFQGPVPIDTFSRFGISAMTATWGLQARNVTITFSEDEFAWNIFLCWAHAALCIYICHVTIRAIHQAHDEFLGYRWQWLRALQPPRATTLLVEGIPDEQRSDESLYAYFARLFSKEAIQRAYIIRRTWSLRRLVARVDQLEEQMKGAQAAFASDPQSVISIGAFRQKSAADLVEDLTGGLQKARDDLEAERLRIEAAAADKNPRVSSESGFVTFTSKRLCRLASREQLKANVAKMKLSLPPHPSDVRYDDLAAGEMAQTGSSVSAYLFTLAVFVLWVPMTAIIGSFTTLRDLKQYSIFHWVNSLPIESQAFLEGILAQLSLKVVMALLPMFLMIIITMSFLKSGNQAQLRMQSRYFTFLVVFVVLVSALNVTLIKTVEDIVENPWAVKELLTKLPHSSHFYMNYLILGWFTLAMALLRVGPLVKYLLLCSSNKTAAEVREMSEPEDQDGDGMGARHARAAHMMTIALVFSALTPTICLAALAWFAVAAHIYKWLMLFSETKKADLGGAFWVGALQHVYASLGLYVTLMMLLLLGAPWGRGFPALVVAICGLYVLWEYMTFRNIVWKSMPFEAVCESEEWLAEQQQGVSPAGQHEEVKYIQPECEAAEANAAVLATAKAGDSEAEAMNASVEEVEAAESTGGSPGFSILADPAGSRRDQGNPSMPTSSAAVGENLFSVPAPRI